MLSLVSHLPGHFNVANTALAALALLTLGLEVTQVQQALAVPPDVPGRMEVVAPGGPDGPRCIVDFAHTPDAVDAALDALRPSTSGRLIAVLGAGGDRDRGKRHGMGRAAAGLADVVVVTDDNPRSEDPATIRAAVLDGARSVGSRAELVEVDGRARAIREGVRLARAGGPGSVVAVVGKGHETGQDQAGVLSPFDDRVVLRAALVRHAGGEAQPCSP